MQYYDKITIWENRRRREFLIAFRNRIVAFFKDAEPDVLNIELSEGEDAQKIRGEINRDMNQAQKFILLGGWRPYLVYTPPPAIGGYIQNVDLILNLFNLHKFRINPKHALDFIDRAIGTYDHDKNRSIIRTFNPFFWTGLFFEWIASLPFRILGRSGFDQSKIEESPIGKGIKALLWFIQIAGAIAIAAVKLIDAAMDFLKHL